MSKNEETSSSDDSVAPAPAISSEAVKPADTGRSIGNKTLVGAAVGIGSAAIVAALLYARKRS